MTALKNYPTEFIERTLELLEDVESVAKEKDREVTLMVNCLLGLVVSVREFTKDSKREKEKFGDYLKQALINSDDTLGEYIEVTNVPSGVSDWKKRILNDDSKELVRLLRNGIAHHNIEPINNEVDWIGIKIGNQSRRNTEPFKFEIEELRMLAKLIAKAYLQYVKLTP